MKWEGWYFHGIISKYFAHYKQDKQLQINSVHNKHTIDIKYKIMYNGKQIGICKSIEQAKKCGECYFKINFIGSK